MLLIIYEFYKNWCIKGPICPGVLIKWHVLWNYVTSETKQHLGKILQSWFSSNL